MNPLAIQPWETLALGLVTMIGVICTSTAAVRSLNTWRHQLNQLKFNAEFEVSRNLMRAVYKYRDAMVGARYINMLYGDVEEDKDGGSPGVLGDWNERFKEIVDARAEMRAVLFEAEFLWGGEIQGMTEPLYLAHGKLVTATVHFYRVRKDESLTRQDEKFAREIMDRYRPTVFPNHDNPENDEFACHVSRLVETIEGFVQKKTSIQHKRHTPKKQ